LTVKDADDKESKAGKGDKKAKKTEPVEKKSNADSGKVVNLMAGE
jgi:hypothetical protein